MIKKYGIITLITLVIALGSSIQSVDYQKPILTNACLQTKYCPNDYAEINFGGFPIQFTSRADINSPGNFADFEDGWNEELFLANTAIHFLFIFIIVIICTKIFERWLKKIT